MKGIGYGVISCKGFLRIITGMHWSILYVPPVESIATHNVARGLVGPAFLHSTLLHQQGANA